MVAPLVAAAGISAVGSVLGGVAGGKGAKKQAKIAQQTQAQQIAAIDRNRNYQYSLNAPTIAGGDAADERIRALLGLGGDAAAAGAAFDDYRASTGYDTRLREALQSVNNRAFAGGVGQSGAALRALQDRGADVAGRYFDTYLAQLGGVSAGGQGARALVAGVGNNAVNQFVGATDAGASRLIDASRASTANTQTTIQNLINAANFGFGSSFAPMSKPAGGVATNPFILAARSGATMGGWGG